MENTIVLNSGEKVEILLLDEVSLDIDCSLRYIKSGQKEISDYVNNTAKPQLDKTIVKAQNDMAEQIAKGVEDASQAATLAASETIFNSIENAEAQISAYVEASIKPELTASVTIASNSAAAAEISKETVLSKTAEFEELSNNIKTSIEQTALNVSNDADQAENSALIAEEAAQKAVSGNIGDIKYTLRTTEPRGGKWCNGAIYTKAQFPDVYRLLTEEELHYVSFDEFDIQVETQGCCGFFGLDTDNETFRVPLIKNVYIKAGTTNLGEFGAESLPNITGTVCDVYFGGQGGAFKLGTTGSYRTAALNNNYLTGTSEFDASLSSPVYQDGAKVNPAHITYRAYIILFSSQDVSSEMSTEYQLNNPFSLLDYKWSEYEITNASWLLSNGTFHSGLTYPSVYQLLSDIKNGTVTKDGVSVKLNTEEYTDYDFVLNETDEIFRLPVKVNLASGAAVVGNGMVLGLTNGTQNFGMTSGASAGGAAYYLGNSMNKYGSPIGEKPVPYTTPLNDMSAGVTTDPRKSGIETSSTNLKLYFYVGETIQDAKIINAAGVLTALEDKIGFEDREIVTVWGLPDYSAGSTVPFTDGQTWEVPYDCELYFVQAVNGGGAIKLRWENSVGNVIFYTGSSTINAVCADRIRLKKGWTIYVERYTTANWYANHIYPLIGAN